MTKPTLPGKTAGVEALLPASVMPRLMSKTEVMEMLGVSDRTLEKLVHSSRYVCHGENRAESDN